ncbi:MAG: radical SAM protein [Candidatus Aenigmarchaeota archaeon]|nr:radical SAM protein [Candidatus Aenigmarchaeota archaeon]
MCDGQKSLSEILKDYDSDSQKVILEFLGNLRQIGAVCFTKEKNPREFPDLVLDPQLQSVHFELTSRCNMRCRHCYQESYLRQPTDLTFEEIQKLVREMRKLQVEKIGISGGEPFMRPDLFEIIRIIEENEIAISSILTNGLSLNNKVIEKLLKCQGQLSLFVSLDGMKPEAMKLRGFGPDQCEQVFNRLIGNIQNAVKAGIPIMINTVVTKDNVVNICQMYDWLKEMEVIGWRIALPKLAGSFTKHQSEFALPREKVFEEYLKIIKRHLETENWKNNNFRLQIEHFFRVEVFENLEILPPTAFVCDYEGKRQSCCIKPNGDVTPCPLYIDLVVGNLRKQSLESIWYSKTMQQIKDIRICDVKGCQFCHLSWLCATGCRANAIFLHDSREAPDDDACAAVKFFIDQVAPMLRENGIKLPEIQERR